jgi:hypothetical protein
MATSSLSPKKKRRTFYAWEASSSRICTLKHSKRKNMSAPADSETCSDTTHAVCPSFLLYHSRHISPKPTCHTRPAAKFTKSRLFHFVCAKQSQPNIVFPKKNTKDSAMSKSQIAWAICVLVVFFVKDSKWMMTWRASRLVYAHV